MHRTMIHKEDNLYNLSFSTLLFGMLCIILSHWLEENFFLSLALLTVGCLFYWSAFLTLLSSHTTIAVIVFLTGAIIFDALLWVIILAGMAAVFAELAVVGKYEIPKHF